MANKNFIVVSDPTGDFWEGSLVDDARARQLESHGVILLPVIPDLFRSSGVGGFHKRSWGAGWSLNTSAPRMIAPLTMYCSKDFSVVHWRARLIPEDGFLALLQKGEPELLTGSLRISGDPSQANPNKISLTPKEVIDIRTLTEKQLVDGGFNIGGSATARVPQDAHYGLALYGFAPGLRVAWAAVSQAAE